MSDEAHQDSARAGSDRRRRHWQILWLCAGILVASAVLGVRHDGRVVIPGLPDHPLPGTCISQHVLGVDCPGCGLTRSFVHLAHGRWDAAWSVHRLGWLAFLAVAIQVPYRLLLIRRARRQLGT